MSLGRGLPSSLGESDGAADGWMSDSGIMFARSSKMKRSPVKKSVTEVGVAQLLTPKATTSTTQGEQQSTGLGISAVLTMKKRLNDLYDFAKTKHNLHGSVKESLAALKTDMIAVEGELKALWARAEKAEAELALKNRRQQLALERAKKSLETLNPMGKRDRGSPGEEEAAKKKKGEEADREDSDWQTVKNKSEKKKKEEVKKYDEKRLEETKKGETRKPKPRNKGDALVIAVSEGTTYAELLRKVRTDPELKELGEKVVKTRRTQKGEMLFELKKDPAVRSAAFKQLVETSLGEKAQVRALSQETVIECKDLDEVATVDELKEALRIQCGFEEPVVIRLRKAYGGTQVASMRVSSLVANKLLEKGKVRVGWSICPLRVVPRVPKEMERCFKCMGFGHHAQQCEGPDRSKLCRKCGEEGHFANDCTKPVRCLLCSREDGNDHTTGGFKCPQYKKALANQE